MRKTTRIGRQSKIKSKTSWKIEISKKMQKLLTRTQNLNQATRCLRKT